MNSAMSPSNLLFTYLTGTASNSTSLFIVCPLILFEKMLSFTIFANLIFAIVSAEIFDRFARRRNRSRPGLPLARAPIRGMPCGPKDFGFFNLDTDTFGSGEGSLRPCWANPFEDMDLRCLK
jgi:hypothetical protein